MELVPIGISTYSRLNHLKQTIKALQGNTLAKESELYVFSDAPKPGDEEKVLAVRSYLKEIDGFKSVHVFERDTNDRIVNNRSGMDDVLRICGKMIFLEEDIVTAPGFLRFMNDALDFYENDEEILSITGYCPPIRIINTYNKDFFVLPRNCAWGMGLYRRTLDVINRPIDKAEFERVSKQKRMYVAGSDVMRMVQQEVVGSLQAGDVRCMYHQLLNSQYTVYPRYSLVQNIGHDGSGEHCGRSSKFHHMKLWGKTEGFVFEKKPKVNEQIRKANFKFRSGSLKSQFTELSRKAGIYPMLKSLKDKIK
ncbi:glycosyltransferase family 2 protein [Thiomicrorhabdus sp.]|uniref:glycosyltransferase family 2 protein n=1 Tax=Thiomicrorhabdus sp. TaxID=2039724 RepID=UPI002AA70655|nr:glycosyltransferase family 2 protein [Thiomicrorhabdus sp.]